MALGHAEAEMCYDVPSLAGSPHLPCFARKSHVRSSGHSRSVEKRTKEASDFALNKEALTRSGRREAARPAPGRD